MLSIKKARELLGKESVKYSDGQIDEMLRVLGVLADIFLKTYANSKAKARPGSTNPDQS